MRTPWAKFSLSGEGPAYAMGHSPEFRRTVREIFGQLVEWAAVWPAGSHAWLMAEVPPDGSLALFFQDLEKRLAPAGSLWVVLPKRPFQDALAFPFSWTDVQQAGLAAGLVDNKIAAFSPRLTSIRFVIPLARRESRAQGQADDRRPRAAGESGAG